MLEAIFLFLFIMIILVVAETDAMVTSAIGECTSKKNKKVIFSDLKIGPRARKLALNYFLLVLVFKKNSQANNAGPEPSNFELFSPFSIVLQKFFILVI